MGANGGNLTDRKKLILKAIVESHIADGEPVGSKSISQNNSWAGSAATVRSEMAELAQMGYLEQPHTSAGRVPSELGYRFYIDSLIEHYAMTAREVAQLNGLMKNKMAELDQILVTASKVACKMTNYTGIAIKPKSSSVSIEKFETVYLSPRSLILVMVTTGDAVKTKNISFAQDVTTDAAVRLSAALNKDLCLLTSDEITLPVIMELDNDMGEDAFLVNPVVKAVYEVMKEIDGGEIRVSGIDKLLQYPEYDDKERLGDLLSAIENKDEILDLVAEGSEAPLEETESSVKLMENSSLVYKPIVKNGKRVGVIGVIGPRRMDYAKVLATLEELGSNITGMLGDGMQLPEKTADGDDKQ